MPETMLAVLASGPCFVVVASHRPLRVLVGGYPVTPVLHVPGTVRLPFDAKNEPERPCVYLDCGLATWTGAALRERFGEAVRELVGAACSVVTDPDSGGLLVLGSARSTGKVRRALGLTWNGIAVRYAASGPVTPAGGAAGQAEAPRVVLPVARDPKVDGGCRSDDDGHCTWERCPQLRDGEPKTSGRHCPLDTRGRDET